MLEIKNLNFSYDFAKPFLTNINLKIESREFIIVLGHNGSGKTTLFKLLSGALKGFQGSVKFNGQDFLNSKKKIVSLLGQKVDESTFGDLTIAENLHIAGFISLKKNNLQEFLSRFNSVLANNLHKKAGLLSGGQRQALALAMITCQNPLVLLLDEHTSALDHAASTNIMELTKEHILQNNLIAMMITHNIDHAVTYGTRVIIMQDGKVVFDQKKSDAIIDKALILDKLYG